MDDKKFNTLQSIQRYFSSKVNISFCTLCILVSIPFFVLACSEVKVKETKRSPASHRSSLSRIRSPSVLFGRLPLVFNGVDYSSESFLILSDGREIKTEYNGHFFVEAFTPQITIKGIKIRSGGTYPTSDIVLRSGPYHSRVYVHTLSFIVDYDRNQMTGERKIKWSWSIFDDMRTANFWYLGRFPSDAWKLYSGPAILKEPLSIEKKLTNEEAEAILPTTIKNDVGLGF